MSVVLGIHAFGHESGACIATPDGLWAMSEERLSRNKYDPSFPAQTIHWALGASGVGSMQDVDLVVYDLLEQKGQRVIEALSEMGFRCKILACRHHEAHAASAFFPSPFDSAAVLTIDAGGSREGETGPGVEPSELCSTHPMYREVQTFSIGSGNRIRSLRRTVVGPPYTINPGVLYGLVSVFLGFGSMGSGKVMGLAAHGSPRSDFKADIFSEIDGNPLASCQSPEPLDDEVVRNYLPQIFGGVLPRDPANPITTDHRDVAAHTQALTQLEVEKLAGRLAATSNQDNLCLSGGYGLNAVTNSGILSRTSFRQLFVQPAATDAGIPLGCALWGYNQLLGNQRIHEMKTAFLGGNYAESEIRQSLSGRTGLSVRQTDTIGSVAAEAVRKGKIIGWFRGRSEFGPRALGHRSILADPRSLKSVERLNESIKFREPFRPYAPIVIDRRADDFFELPAPSPFMLLIGRVREKYRSQLPAVTHVDNTARVQVLSAHHEPVLYELLLRFGEFSGIPVLLNTSFNRAGEPIVETPGDALKVLEETELDAVAMENFWIEKTTRKESG